LRLGLILRKKKSKVFLSEQGMTFLQFNPKETYDLSAQQKKFLIRNYFFDGAYSKELKECLKCFDYSDQKKIFAWSSIDSTPFGTNAWIINHLEQLGVAVQTSYGYRIVKTYNETVLTLINDAKGFTEEQLMKWLEEKKYLGDSAEKLVVKFEEGRLRKIGNLVEAACVKCISKMKTDAGFDIKSFNGKSRGMQYDRFIEVKGSGSTKLRFVWSPNEMKVAEKLREQYWIYFQGGINKKDGNSRFKPIMIQDPITNIYNDARLTITQNGIIVEGGISGEVY
jgi:hypothetical protein